MQPASDQPPHSNNLRRWGPLALIVVVLLVVGAVVVVSAGGGDDDDDDDIAVADTTVAGNDDVGAPEATGRMPVTYNEAKEAGTLDEHEWSDGCDPETGLLKVPSVYAAPCVPVFADDDNGGATAPGVTGDTVRIVRYVNEQSADIQSLIAGIDATDTEAEIAQTHEDYLAIFSSRAELYGRTIELVDFQATGVGDDVVAAKADATQIVNELQPFAVLGGPGLDRGVFAEELTSHGIVCIDCSGPVTEEMAEDMEPFVWAGLPSAEQFLQTLNAWLANFAELPDGGENAAFAGTEELRNTPRKIGVIHFDFDPPLLAPPEGDVPEEVGDIESYVLDFATMPGKATELMAKFKSEGITTILFLGDPIMPQYLTQAATAQEYFPEWVFTGTALTDTNILARLWDKQQMTQAFGISQLAAPVKQELQDAVKVYRWYFGEDAFPPASNQYALAAAAAGFIVRGVQMAGPDLTAETFAQGQFRIPPAGGGPTTPQVSYGDWGFFDETDYTGIDDSAEIWWDPTVEVEDETGTVGVGAWRRAHMGERFINEDNAPVPDPFANQEDTVTVLTTRPAEDTAPDYPPPPGSPAETAG
jgi:hypothetical protein